MTQAKRNLASGVVRGAKKMVVAAKEYVKYTKSPPTYTAEHEEYIWEQEFGEIIDRETNHTALLEAAKKYAQCGHIVGCPYWTHKRDASRCSEEFCGLTKLKQAIAAAEKGE